VKRLPIARTSLMLALLASGCATSGARFYPGTPLQTNQVSVLVVRPDTGVYLAHIGDKVVVLQSLGGSLDILEVLPGEYELCIGFRSSSTYGTTSSTGCSSITLDAELGHVYYVYPEFPEHGSWKPVVADFGSDEAFSKFHPGVFSSLDSGDKIKAMVAKYFQSDRRYLFSEK